MMRDIIFLGVTLSAGTAHAHENFDPYSVSHTLIHGVELLGVSAMIAIVLGLIIRRMSGRKQANRIRVSSKR